MQKNNALDSTVLQALFNKKSFSFFQCPWKPKLSLLMFGGSAKKVQAGVNTLCQNGTFVNQNLHFTAVCVNTKVNKLESLAPQVLKTT